MSWQSIADRPELVRRERFATRFNVLAIFCAFVFLLILLYPEKGLLSLLRKGNDAATVRYREPLLRIRPDDIDLRLKVADSFVRSGNPRRAIEILSDVPTKIAKPQTELLNELRYTALKTLFSQVAPHSAEWRRIRPKVMTAARLLGGPTPAAWRLQNFAADALDADDREAWIDYSKKAEAKLALENAPVFIEVPRDDAEKAEMAGDYRGAATICFSLMKMANSIEKKRELFIRAVRLLQSGNLPMEAFEEGERQLGELGNDRETLIFLNRVGLSVGQLSRAQRLIKRALGMDGHRFQRGV